MNIKASGRSALIIAAGFWLCVAGPLQAAEDADGGATASNTESAAGAPIALNNFTTRKSRYRKHVSSHRKSVKVAARASHENARLSEHKSSERKSSENKPPEKKKSGGADASAEVADSQSTLPLSVANANAQLAAADLPADDTNSVSTKAVNVLRTMAAKQADAADPQAPAPAPANTGLVAADELNDVDRALSENKSEEKPVLAPTVALAMAQAPVAVSSEDSTWGQTSLIGKIFIAFGGLLTLASAARMFMA
jgi:hypothetical protein